jgi:NAD(P)-dependent dehydrogenase (short-subunit alcohol dehydrogenase family)
MNNLNYNFNNNIFLITGATSGIGKALAIFIAKNNGRLILTYRNEEKLNEIKQILGNNLIHSIFIDLEDIDKIADEIVKVRLNGEKIQGFIHCAGIADPRPLLLMNKTFYERIFNLNLFSFFEISRILLKSNMFHSPSSIIAISSIQSKYGDKGKIAYGASKGALDSAVKSMAKELQNKGIRVNTIVPGLIQTEIFEEYQKAIGKDQIDSIIKSHQYLGLGYVSDVVNAIAFLLSEESKFITGTNLVVDGGWLS